MLTGFKAGIGLVIVLDQVPKLLGIHITKQGFFPDLLSVAQHIPETSLADARRGCRDARHPGIDGAPLAALAGTAGGRRAPGSRRRGTWASQALGVSTVGHIPQGLPSITLPDLALAAQLAPAAAGIALMSFTETIAAGRAFARPGDPPVDANRELVAVGAGNLTGALFGRDAVGRRNVADSGRPRRRRPDAEDFARHGGRRAGDHALPGASARACCQMPRWR